MYRLLAEYLLAVPIPVPPSQPSCTPSVGVASTLRDDWLAAQCDVLYTRQARRTAPVPLPPYSALSTPSRRLQTSFPEYQEHSHVTDILDILVAPYCETPSFSRTNTAPDEAWLRQRSGHAASLI